MELSGKVAIVTGASSGIGMAAAVLLSKKGTKVALVSRSIEKLERLSKGLPDSIAIEADVTKGSELKAAVEKVVKTYGRVDILMNNAGQGYDSPIENTDIAIFRNIFELDVVAPVEAMKLVIPIMRKAGGGAIVNVSSGMALMRLPGQGTYSSLKRALADISLVARMELAKDNISVGVAYPYVTITDFERNTLKFDPETGLTKTDDSSGEAPQGLPHPPDTAEFAAQAIVEGIEKGEAEIFAHEWMKPRQPAEGNE